MALNESHPTRTIHHANALTWLSDQQKLVGCSIITSLPDISEFPSFTLSQWKTWFTQTAQLVLSKTADDGLTIFFQTDIKKDGEWVDKGFLCQMAAQQNGHRLIAHKIISRIPPGNITYGRPAYSHLLCFSKNLKVQIEKSSPDVLPHAGKKTWTRGMGLEACRLACQMVIENTTTRTIVDPFCGHGSVIAVANDLGLNAIGVELSRKRAEIAKTLTMEALQKTKVKVV